MVHSRSVITAVFAVGAASSALAIPLPSSGVAAGGFTGVTSNVLLTPDSTGPPAPASTDTVKPSGNGPFAGAEMGTQKHNARELDIIVEDENESLRHMGKHHLHHHHVHVHDEEKEIKMEVEEHYHHDYHNHHGEEEVGVEVKEHHSHYHPHHHYAGEELEIEVKEHHHHHHNSGKGFDVAPEEHHRHGGEEFKIDIKEFSGHHHRHHKYPWHHAEHENEAEIIAAPVPKTKAEKEKVILVLDMPERAGVHSRARQMERRHAKGSSPPSEPASGDSKQSSTFFPPSTGQSLSPIREESSPELSPPSGDGKRHPTPSTPVSSSSGSKVSSRSIPYRNFGGDLD
ncbi:hypothetical protein F5050DRAFT_1784174 [Lentinula boryana]|uniref:Uncharacterized protein n=1 Tax=Lentinula boryana TaxID=40481 RepID=A0ABQ8Q525_9AGAR|nr:hypothetical protein F5050DRAFT_1784174 [Lentinula boryana]